MFPMYLVRVKAIGVRPLEADRCRHRMDLQILVDPARAVFERDAFLSEAEAQAAGYLVCAFGQFATRVEHRSAPGIYEGVPIDQWDHVLQL